MTHILACKSTWGEGAFPGDSTAKEDGTHGQDMCPFGRGRVANNQGQNSLQVCMRSIYWSVIWPVIMSSDTILWRQSGCFARAYPKRERWPCLPRSPI